MVEERVVVREPAVVVEPGPVVAPATVVVATPAHRVWERGRWEHRGHERVWVDAHWRS